MVSEKVGGAEGTKLDEDFKDLERVTCKFTSQESIYSKNKLFWLTKKDHCDGFLCLQKADVTSKAVVEIISKTSEYLQPNPATRAKLTMLGTVSKIRGQVKSPGYPQPEGLLGECMTKYGRDMGQNTGFGENTDEQLVS